MDPSPSHMFGSENRDEEVSTEDDVRVLRDQISLLKEEVAELQGNLAAQEGEAQRVVNSEGFMLAELQKASDQLLCEYPTSSPPTLDETAWFDPFLLFYSCSS